MYKYLLNYYKYSVLVPKRANSIKINARGIFKGAIVVRGTDWYIYYIVYISFIIKILIYRLIREWQDQDGNIFI